MNIFKKVVSMILVLSMIFSLGIFNLDVFAEEEIIEAETDVMKSEVVLDAKDISVANKLAALGFIDEVDEGQLVRYLTRGDIIDILVKYLELDEIEMSVDVTPFIDVSLSDPQIGEYSMLYKLGYISGDAEKTFRPKALLTYNEAITFVVNAMGYKVLAVRNGGYPSGYLNTAVKSGMLKGIRGGGSAPIPYCDLYRIIEASLGATAIVTTSYTGDGEADIQMVPGTTVLDATRGYVKIAGKITGTENTRLYTSDSSKIGMYQIEIERKIYETPKQSYADLLGYNVIAYLDKNAEDEDTIVYLEAHPSKNTEFKLSADELLPELSTGSRIYYEDENYKQKHIEVDLAHLKVIKNGKNTGAVLMLQDCLPDTGYIVGLDNSGDGVVDILFIYEYKNFVVGVIDITSYRFFEKYTGEVLVLDPIEDDVRVYDSYGNLLRVKDIAVGDLITVLETDNGTGYKLFTVYKEGRTVEGTPTMKSSEGKLLIGNEYFEIADSLQGYIDEGYISEIQLGKSGKFYLDREYKIANYELNATTSLTYGYVYDCGSKQTDMENTIGLKIFTQAGEYKNFTVAETVKIDGAKYKINQDDEDFDDALTEISTKAVNNLILYSEAGGQITEIDTANPAALPNDSGNLNIVSEGTDFVVRNGNATEEVTSGSPQNFVINLNNCITYEVPVSLEADEKFEEHSSVQGAFYQGRNVFRDDGLEFTKNYGIPIHDYVAYNLDKSGIPVITCIVLRRDVEAADSLSTSSPIGIVSDISHTYNADEELVEKLYYTVNGVEKGVVLSKAEIPYYGIDPSTLEDESASGEASLGAGGLNLQAGDVIQVGLDNNGEVDSINLVYRPSTLAADSWLESSPYSYDFDNKTGGALIEVEHVDAIKGYMSYTADGITDYTSIQSGEVVIYNSVTKKVTQATSYSFVQGDTAIIFTDTNYGGKFSQAIIIR